MLRSLAVLPLLAVVTLFAQEPTSTHEAVIGLGIGSSPERSVFNLPSGDIQGSPDLVYWLAYHHPLDARLAVGVHLHGYVQTIQNVSIVDASSTTRTVSFDLSPITLGVSGRYLLSTGGVQPYIIGIVGLAAGSLHSDEVGTLNMLGITAGAGAGLRFLAGESIAISVQGIGSLGTARFKERPFLNSSGKEFNPGLFGVTVNVAYLW